MAYNWRLLKRRVVSAELAFLGLFLLVFITEFLSPSYAFALGRRGNGSDDAKRATYPFELISDWELAPVEAKPKGVRVADVNGDGEIDFLCMYPTYFQIRNINGGVFCQVNIHNKYIIGNCLDIDDDGKLEIFVSIMIKDTFFLHVYDYKGILLRKIDAISGEDVRPPLGWDGYCAVQGLIDVNRDGTKDLVTRVNTGLDRQPRGVFVYDYQTGSEMWHFLMGTSPNKLSLADINGNGNQEIVVPTSAPENGSDVNGTNDSTSYVIALDNSGDLLWKNPLGRVFSSVEHMDIVDIDGDGVSEIVAQKISWRAEDPEQDRIYIIDARDGEEIKHRNIGKYARGQVVGDWDRDGRDEIIVGGCGNGTELWILNSNLDTISSYSHTPWIEPQLTDDIDGNGTQELICLTGDNRLLILNEKFAELASFRYGNIGTVPKVIGVSMREESPKRIVLLADRLYVLRLQKRFLTNYGGWLVENKFLMVIVILSLVAIALIWRGSRHSPTSDRLLLDVLLNNTEKGIIRLDADKRVIGLNPGAEMIFNLKAESVLGKTFQDVFQRDEHEKLIEIVGEVNESFKEPLTKEITLGTLDQLRHLVCQISLIKTKKKSDLRYLLVVEDVTDRFNYKRIRTWGNRVQGLSHRMKSPLSSIRMRAQHLSTISYQEGEFNAKEIVDYARKIEGEVGKLDNLTRGFVEVTKLGEPELKRCDLNTVVRETLDRLPSSLLKGIEVKTNIQKDLPDVVADKGQIHEVLEILIENSLEAMDQGGTLSVSTSLVQHISDSPSDKLTEDSIQVEVSDTGEGISTHNKDEIFKLGFSTKPNSMGIGLAIARSIVENHKGEMKFESEEGLGTSFAFLLPIT